ncbi:MAG: carboxymuconolactone decarboxylase family protein [Methanotrichaceae archaeon]|nr:carboxymuconolactone decarboxylase family protein [Methanotrichaceae archaeon]
MTGETPRHFKFGEALGTGINSAFINLRSEIMKNGALSTKEKALIALASVVALQCDYCVEFHKEVAMSAGATKEEMLEAAAVGGLVRLGSGFASASMILENAKK